MRIPVINLSQSNQVNSSVTIQLHPGNIYRGTVVGINPDSVILRIGGMLIKGTGQLALELGQVLTMRAEQADDSTLLLRVLPVERAQSSSTPPLTQALKYINIPSSFLNTAAAKALLTWLQPVGEGEVAQLAQEAKNMPKDKQLAYLSLRGWTKAADIPEERLTIKSVTRFLLGLAEPEEIAAALHHINKAEQPFNYPLVNILWWQSHGRSGELYNFKEYDPEQCIDPMRTIALRVATKNYGDLWVRLNFNSESINILFMCSESELLDLLRTKESQINEAITAAGLSLTGVDYKVDTVNSFLDIVPPKTKDYRSVNILV